MSPSLRFLVTALALVVLTAPSSQHILVIDVPGQPFMALPSRDGSTIFVSVQTPGTHKNEIDVFHRAGGAYTKGRTIQVDGTPRGLALTPDGAILLVADGDRYLALSAEAAQRDAPLSRSFVFGGSQPGAIQVVATPNGRLAFFSNERSSSVGVARIDPAAAESDAPRLIVTGFIPVDHLPVGLAMSPDGLRLYVTSEFASFHPRSCGNTPPGTVSVINVLEAESDPAHAVMSSVVVGCDPVRVATSPDGHILWVTVRGEDRLAAFDAQRLVDDPAHALLRSSQVGPAPVGLLVAQKGNTIVVANSDRFNRNAENSTLDVIDAKAALAGKPAILETIPTGAFPREMRESPAADAIYLTNFNGDTVEVIAEPLAPPH